MHTPEAYLEPSRISKMELFAKSTHSGEIPFRTLNFKNCVHRSLSYINRNNLNLLLGIFSEKNGFVFLSGRIRSNFAWELTFDCNWFLWSNCNWISSKFTNPSASVILKENHFSNFLFLFCSYFKIDHDLVFYLAA